MHCPSCQHKHSFLECARIVNPFRHPCPACRAPLSFGRQAWAYIATAISGGGGLAALAICLEQSGQLTPDQAVTAFAMAFSVAAGAGEWLCWKRGTLLPATRKR